MPGGVAAPSCGSIGDVPAIGGGAAAPIPGGAAPGAAGGAPPGIIDGIAGMSATGGGFCTAINAWVMRSRWPPPPPGALYPSVYAITQPL